MLRRNRIWRQMYHMNIKVLLKYIDVVIVYEVFLSLWHLRANFGTVPSNGFPVLTGHALQLLWHLRHLRVSFGTVLFMVFWYYPVPEMLL